MERFEISIPRIRSLATVVLAVLAAVLLAGTHSFLKAQMADLRYNIGTPVLADLWVDPVNGNDSNSGTARAQALRTIGAAWRLIPSGAALADTGYRINLFPGTFPCEGNCQNFFGDRAGTFQFPIIIRPADGRGTVTIEGGLNLSQVRYLYLSDLNIVAGGAAGTFSNDVIQCTQCDHVLMRGLTVTGLNRDEFQEVIKSNQSQDL